MRNSKGSVAVAALVGVSLLVGLGGLLGFNHKKTVCDVDAKGNLVRLVVNVGDLAHVHLSVNGHVLDGDKVCPPVVTPPAPAPAPSPTPSPSPTPTGTGGGGDVPVVLPNTGGHGV